MPYNRYKGKYMDYERPKIKVHCPEDGWVDEQDTEFVNIEEDIQGADILTFICPHCKQQRKSRRYA
jgi:SPX domain protein involved in polyphosphate accumulation